MGAACVFRQNYSLPQAIPVAAALCDRTVIKVAASMLSGLASCATIAARFNPEKSRGCPI